jgi:hypothetical protein
MPTARQFVFILQRRRPRTKTPANGSAGAIPPRTVAREADPHDRRTDALLRFGDVR